MKILQVTPFFSPIYGGSARQAYEISKWLSKNGHEVTVYTSDFRVSEEWIKNVPHVKVYPFKTWLCWANFFVTLGMIKKAREATGHFDMIHMHNYRSFQNIIMAHYAAKHGVPYVLQAHGSLPSFLAKEKIKRIFDSLFGYKLLKGASKVIAITKTEAQQYLNIGVPEEKIEIVPNGIDMSEYSCLPHRGVFKKKFSIDDDNRIVLYLGRLHRIKGVDILVRAFVGVTRKLDKVKLVVAGPDDGYLGELEFLIRALKLDDDVLISGPLYGKDKLEAYVDADICVLPSRYEIFGMTALESVACSTPVILTENCGVAEHFRGKAGIVVENCSQHLQRALLEMLMDQKKLIVFEKNCRTMAASLDVSKTVSRLESVYRKIVESSPLNVQNEGPL